MTIFLINELKYAIVFAGTVEFEAVCLPYHNYHIIS